MGIPIGTTASLFFVPFLSEEPANHLGEGTLFGRQRALGTGRGGSFLLGAVWWLVFQNGGPWPPGRLRYGFL
jgi:hypothetical protein